MDEQVSEEEDDVEYHPEETDTSDESDEEVKLLRLLRLKDSSPKMIRSVGAQYLMMYMAGKLLQMSSK